MCISYLHVRLLSLRPVLAGFIALDTSDREIDPLLQNFLSRRVIFQCSVVCLRVACEAIHTVAKRRSNDPGAMVNLAPWWHNVHFLCSAATVLIAARLSDILLSEVSESVIFAHWRQAIEALEHYSVYGSSVKRIVTTLRVLFDAVQRQPSRFRFTPHTEPVVVQLQKSVPVETAATPTQEVYVEGGYVVPESSRPVALERDYPGAELVLGPSDFQEENNIAFDWNDLSWLTTINSF